MSRIHEPTHPAVAAPGTKPRHRWVDIAKAVSIVFVVLWHTVGDKLWFFELLVFVRMPLFFFAAGLFAASALSKPWPVFLRDKIANWLYLYVLWYYIAYLMVTAPSVDSWDSRDLPRIASLFFEPVPTLWFIYGLALVFLLAKIVARFGIVPILGLLLPLYMWSVTNGHWDEPSLIDRIVRLSPYFLLGAFALRIVDRIPAWANYLWLPFAVLYLVLSNAILHTGLDRVGAVTMLVTGAGLAAIVLFSRSIQDVRAAEPLRFIGMRTLHIYVLHRIGIPYINLGLEALGMPDGVGKSFLQAIIVIPLCLIGGLAIERLTPWLFSAPWIGGRHKRGKAVRVAPAG